ncbi:MaoC family dehydratase N-terminal domain-containing protein [uncultured Sphingomonas sp.]|uniref:FAS1-like dehydratase domain-containing protein n=1 Tax=uncultured Sphingomonas sp. TaxID=158754 RepID=UPI00261F2977|nr:MaoC family dehydratase N-terminal domain-containing protein [uncultured Sphingomonas sp.]
MDDWSEWAGRTETQTDRADPGVLARWCATLDRAAPLDGTAPLGFHWCLCLPDAPTAMLSPDGHPRRDLGPRSFLPPITLPRRMWASSRMEFLQPIRTGDAIERRSRIISVTHKHGASGELIFVDLAHDVLAAGELALREVQSIVYREAAPKNAPPSPPLPGIGSFDPAGWDAIRTIAPAAPLLFRYSALTFNSHRIHYDLAYATAKEGYRGLVVHAPLTATLLLELARRELGEQALKTFSFRGVSPAIAGETLHLAMRSDGEAIELGAFAADGRRVMQARADR